MRTEAAQAKSRGGLAWSNEFVLHLVELKNLRPDAHFEPLAAAFQAAIARLNRLLAPLGGRLVPGAMHPWLDPRAERRLRPHQHAEIYCAYDRIFDCSRHGWANLQSIRGLPQAGLSYPPVAPSGTDRPLHPGNGREPRRLRRADTRADVPRHHSARATRRTAPRRAELPRCDRTRRPASHRDSRDRSAGMPASRSDHCRRNRRRGEVRVRRCTGIAGETAGGRQRRSGRHSFRLRSRCRPGRDRRCRIPAAAGFHRRTLRGAGTVAPSDRRIAAA